MSDRSSSWHPPRTVVIGAGAAGQHIVQAAHARCAERGLPAANVAWLAIAEADVAAEGQEQRPSGSASGLPGQAQAGAALRAPIVSVPLPRSEVQWSRRTARQAALAAGGDVVAALAAAFAAISRVPPPVPLPLSSRRSQALAEPACLLVAALDDPFGGGLICDLAYLARHLARQRLNTALNVTGILLLPDSLAVDDPEAAQARAYAALCELEAVMRPHDGWRTNWGDSVQVDGMGPVFDKGCFLLSSLNSQGLSLQDHRERVEMAAEVLVQLALSPLGARCDSPLPAGWNDGEPMQVFSSLGAAAWVYPSRALIESARLRMAQVILEAWLQPTPPEIKAQACSDGTAWLELEHLDLPAVSQVLMASGQLAAQGLQRPIVVPLSAKTARAVRSTMDAVLADRLAPLLAVLPEMDREAKALAARLSTQVAANVSSRLDFPASGRLDEAAVFLDATRLRLQQVLGDLSAKAQDRRRILAEIDRELARLAKQLDALGASFPEAQALPVLRTLCSPKRVIALAKGIGGLRQMAPVYGAHLAQRAATEYDLTQGELAGSVYEAALAEVMHQQQRVEALVLASAAAHKLVSRAGPPLVGGLGFSLEQSILTPELVEHLYRSVQGTVVELLADLAGTPDRLSAWPSADPDGEDLAGVCLDFAHRRCAALAQVAIEPLLLASLGAEPQRRGDALQALTAAASPFLSWDEARLRSNEHQMLYECAVLGLPPSVSTASSAELSSPLLDGLGEILWAQVIQSNDPHRVTALCAVHGLPLTALAGQDEYAAAFAAQEAKTPEALRIFEGWELLLNALPSEERPKLNQEPDPGLGQPESTEPEGPAEALSAAEQRSDCDGHILS